MRLLGFYLFSWNANSPHLINSTTELSHINFFTRRMVKEGFLFSARLSVSRLKPGNRVFLDNAQEPNLKSYVYIDQQKLAIVIIFDHEYPQKVLLSMGEEINQEFYNTFSNEKIKNMKKDEHISMPKLEIIIKKYQDPKEADKLLKIKTELEFINEIMHKNIDDILKRGELLEDLINKSNDLSGMSYNFYKQSRNANKKCCSLY